MLAEHSALRSDRLFICEIISIKVLLNLTSSPHVIKDSLYRIGQTSYTSYYQKSTASVKFRILCLAFAWDVSCAPKCSRSTSHQQQRNLCLAGWCFASTLRLPVDGLSTSSCFAGRKGSVQNPSSHRAPNPAERSSAVASGLQSWATSVSNALSLGSKVYVNLPKVLAEAVYIQPRKTSADLVADLPSHTFTSYVLNLHNMASKRWP